MRLLVDGVFFQLASSGIARVWASVLPRLIARGKFDVFLLDRGGLPHLPGATTIPFPSYTDRYTADDSFLLQKICDFFAIDVFTSTYYTSPVSTPMLLMIHDMIPEVFEFDLKERFWREKEISISFARRLVAVSNNTKQDLLRFYPEIPDEMVRVAYEGVDKAVFKPVSDDSVATFRRKIGFERPYFLLVGSREQHRGYKNSKLFFEAFAMLGTNGIDVLCMGGEEEIAPTMSAMMPPGVRLARRAATDGELVLAYNGALALVYPSLYEGFGLPVIEAMACGCPVITTTCGALRETTGDACLTVDPESLPQMISALEAVQGKSKRVELQRAGMARANAFEWDTMVDVLEEELLGLAGDHKGGRFDVFFENWRKMRELQASVDEETLI